MRPWDRTLYVKVVRGFLKQGDQISITFGDRSGGSPGMRLQTFCEESYEFHTLIDPIATYCYQPVPTQPTIKIVPGAPQRYIAIGPTIRAVGENFSVKFKGEDKWGNPSDQCDVTFHPKSQLPLAGLPETVCLKNGEFASSIDNLVAQEAGDLAIDFHDDGGALVFSTNPIRIEEKSDIAAFLG